ncbi:MAG: shikimate dehydrogenase [Armatimonadetes bacterium]|nr:shikimate dehydrogenase [Armatimonadota bacterium]MDE2205344.1 shikimate dehydrogenase [Armatimonadota bacterium]
MERFAFLIHPIDVRRDVGRKYPIARYLPVWLLEWYIKHRSPIVVSEIKGIRSLTGVEAEGWFIGCPLTPRQMVTLPIEHVWDKLEECARIAEGLGARILGLGAFTSVVGDGGVTLSRRVPDLAITTGNSYTVATAIEGVRRANTLMGRDLRGCTVAVVGASGSIGATCALVLGREAKSIHLIGRSADKLQATADRLAAAGISSASITTDVAEGLRDADAVVTVTSSVDAVILPEQLKPGAVVCDVARPRDVSVRVARERNDVLVIEGGVVKVPGEMTTPRPDKPGAQFSFGFPPGTAYACMSETMMLALERRYECFTLGKEVSVEQVEQTDAMAARHGFELAGFRSFERAVTPEEIERVRRNAAAHPAGRADSTAARGEAGA